METESLILRRRGGFVPWRKLATCLRESDYRMVRDVANDWFVCCDDLGSEYMTPFTRSGLVEFATLREGKWTVFTANLTLEQIGMTFDPRIASRLIRHGSVVLDVDVEDFNTRGRPHLEVVPN
jgi:DNA replication protein DnaC